MVMIDPALFQSEWFVNLSVDERYMYLYLLVNADCKIGAIEWNERLLNFCANCSRKFTKADILKSYGGRIQQIPGHENTLIVVDYLRFNWLKNGAELNPHNPLHKSIIARLSSFDLTVDKLNEMSKRKIKVADVSGMDCDRDSGSDSRDSVSEGVSESDLAQMFDGFWNAYPKECPRKTDKKKCLAKFSSIIKRAKDSVKMFNDIMAGLDKWKACSQWNKDGGQFIRAPLVWLNNENWNDEPNIGGRYANGRGATSANANYQSAEASGLF